MLPFNHIMKKSLTIGTPLSPNATKVMLLGSGELGKEVIIALQRLGVETIAVDRYADAPGQQVAHRSHVVDMTNGAALRSLIEKEKPHFVVPEIEAIAAMKRMPPKSKPLLAATLAPTNANAKVETRSRVKTRSSRSKIIPYSCDRTVSAERRIKNPIDANAKADAKKPPINMGRRRLKWASTPPIKEPIGNIPHTKVRRVP